jgi:hypothetical protein
MIRANAAAWHRLLTSPGDLHLRPSPGKWSALEYGCHVRADIIAAHFGNLAPGQWQRTGSRSDGAHFTVESFARYFIHDPVHQLYDITGTRYAAQQ